MNEANRILDDVFFIIAIITLPLWMLKILGYERMVRENERSI